MPQYLADIKDGLFTMGKDEARHLKVARHAVGGEIKIFDGKGNKYSAKLTAVSDKSAGGSVLAPLPAPILKREVHLYFSVVSRAAAEEIIDKATQAGASKFIPIISEYSEKDFIKKWETKKERWAQIALAACKQCENPTLPQIEVPISFTQALKNLGGADLKGFICYEDEHHHSLIEQLASFKNKVLPLFIGPEGGFTQQEIKLAKLCGIRPVSLGQNILRAETAATVACWAAQQ